MRTALIAAIALAVLAGCSSNAPDRLPGAAAPAGASSPAAAEPSPKITPSAAPSAKPATSIRNTDWRNVTLRGLDICGRGDVRFSQGQARTGGYSYRMLPDGARAAYGDLDGDGRDDAVLSVQCADRGEYGSNLVAVRTVGGLRQTLGSVATEDWLTTFTAYRVERGAILATVQTEDGNRISTQDRRYRWNGTAFE